MFSKEQKLFIVLAGFFLANALIAEIIGGKIFSLEKTLGMAPANVSLFGQDGLGFNLTAGVLMWPFVFIMTDIINEYYGKRGVRMLSYLACGLIAYAFLMLYAAREVPPADFWATYKDAQGNLIDQNGAFNQVLGQSNWIILGSLTAFLIGQLVDVTVFQWIKKKTGDGNLWLRATGSTLVSQLIDSFVVLFIAFYIGSNWTLVFVLAVCLMNYLYKSFMALALTPVLYLVHRVIDNYLGPEKAAEMMRNASGEK